MRSTYSAARLSAMTTSAHDLFAEIEALAPSIIARTAEIEAARRTPLDLVEALRSIGVFRMFVPGSHGGLEFDLPTALAITARLGSIDGSVGWTAMIGSANALFAPLLPRDTFEQVYRNGPDAIIAGSTQPTGIAEKAAGGWQVTGRWPFASGCQHADWIFGCCVPGEDRELLSGPFGQRPPQIRGFMLPAREWQIEDTWHAAGLKGTGSHHIALRDKLVPAANIFDLANGESCLPGPLYQAVQQLLPLPLGAIAVGIAEGAIDDLVALARTGRQQQRAAVLMRESETFHYELGRVAADLRAAQALLQGQAASHWRHALAGTLRDEAFGTQSIQTAIRGAATTLYQRGKAASGPSRVRIGRHSIRPSGMRNAKPDPLNVAHSVVNNYACKRGEMSAQHGRITL